MYNMGVSLLVVIAILLIAFTIGVVRGRHRVVDEAWGLAFAGVAATTLILSTSDEPSRWLAGVCTIVWGLRLFIHIHLRGRGTAEDPRYDAILSKAPGNRDRYALRVVYLPQALVAWFISLPVQVAAYDPDVPAGWLIAGGALWLLGLGFEAVGDAQLAAFRANPANTGKVLDTGLWRYTRHPNYFGDACVWWGLFLLACGSWIGVATIVCPIVMTYFLAAKTGKPLMEGHLRQHRPGYDAYVARTSGFFPLPPKKS